MAKKKQARKRQPQPGELESAMRGRTTVRAAQNCWGLFWPSVLKAPYAACPFLVCPDTPDDKARIESIARLMGSRLHEKDRPVVEPITILFGPWR